MSDILDFDSLYDLTQKDPDRTLNLAIILQARHQHGCLPPLV